MAALNKYLKSILIFLSGAVFYQIALIVFFGSIEYQGYNVRQSGYGMSTGYFKEELKEVFDHLENKGCRCEPIVRTSESCKPILGEFIGEKYWSKFLE